MSRIIRNWPVRTRFEALAELHGLNQLAEHVGLRLGWDKASGGERQEPRMYRRGVLVALGIEPNRANHRVGEIAASQAAAMHAILDQVEAGSALRREGADSCDLCNGRGKLAEARGAHATRCYACGGSGRQKKDNHDCCGEGCSRCRSAA